MFLIKRFIVFLSNQKGMSMASVLVASGMLGLLSIGLGEVMKRIKMGEREIASVQNQFELQKEMALLLDRENHCKAGLVWQTADRNLGTIKLFAKSAVSDYKAGKSRRVELWTAKDGTGTRGTRKFFDGQKYGKITIKSIRFTLDSSTGQLPPRKRSHKDLGKIHVVVSRKMANNRLRDHSFTFPLEVNLTTNNQSLARINTCHGLGAAGLGRGRDGDDGENGVTEGMEHFKATETYTYAGMQAGNSSTIGVSNTFLGFRTGLANLNGRHNTFSGHQSGRKNTEGSDNAFFGVFSGHENTEGNFNTFMGSYSGHKNTEAENNTFVGYVSGYGNTTGINNTFLGASTGKYNTTGLNNIFIGFKAGFSNKGSQNVYIGESSGATSEANHNTIMGYKSGHKIRSASENTFIGAYSGGETASNSNDNVFMGFKSGEKHTAGNANVMIGSRAGYNHANGANNVFVGSLSARDSTRGHNNTFLGASTGAKNSANSNTFIGHTSGQKEYYWK